MKSNAVEFKKFSLTMLWFIPFVLFCLIIITNALKPGQRIVQQEVVNAVAPTPIPITQPDVAPQLAEAAPAAVTVAAPETETTIYVVQEGDTLSYIAMLFTGKPSNYKKIAADNNIDNPDLIFPGQKLYVP